MFTDINQALAIAKSNLGIQPTNTARDSEITAILEASKGVDVNGIDNYRPYLVAAYFLPTWGLLARQGLIEADGAKWLKPSDFLPLIQSLLTLQEASDCGLTIDPCWLIEDLRIRLTCGCKADEGGLAVLGLGAFVP